MAREMENALNECIARMPAEGTAAEICAMAYPAYADELVPLVELAHEIRCLPRPEPPAEGLAQLQALVRQRARAQREADQARRFRLPRRQISRLVQVAALIVMTLVLSMGSVTVAAESLPGSPLYPMKRAMEQAQLQLTLDPEQEATLRLAFAERRANEIVALAHRGRPVDEITLAVMLDETGIAIRQLQNLPPDAARTLLPRALQILDFQQICLVHIRPNAPKEALTAIDQAIQICQQRAALIRQMQQELNQRDDGK